MAETTGTDRISIENVESWVQAMGCKSSRTVTPETNWVLEVEYPISSTHRINIINTKLQPLAIGIVTGVGLAQEFTDAFVKLSSDGKKEFRWELVKALSSDDVEFNLKETQEGHPQGFEIMATRYWDGLSLDAFARSMFAVYKTEIVAINCVRRFL
jgi:hypothetical protein